MSVALAYVRSVPELFRISFASNIAYRAELIIWILTATMPLVMLGLWNAVVADGQISGYGTAEVTRYFAATLIVRQATSAWMVWKLNWEIRTGAFSSRLLRPMNPLWTDLILTITALPLRLAVLIPMVGALVLWRPDLLAWPGLDALALFVPSLLLAFLLTFLVQCAFGLLAFWFDKSESLFGVWFSVWMVLSGYIAPVGMFPDWARAAIDWLPFRGMLGVPTELLGGFLTPREAMGHMGVQLGWVLIFGGIVWLLWRRGLQRYGAFGA